MCTGDFGTNARHPPRERIDSPISNYVPREGVAALPYTESLTSAEHVIIASNGAFPCGGHGGPPLRGGFVNNAHSAVVRWQFKSSKQHEGQAQLPTQI